MTEQPEPLQPLVAELGTCQPDRRSEALGLAVDLYGRQNLGIDADHTSKTVLHAAGEFLNWLTARAVRLEVGEPVISEQGHPARRSPLHRTGADMAVTIKDTQVVTYPAASETDSKGFPVSGDVITISEDSAGAVVSMQENPDGSVAFSAVAPGSAQVSWTDGTLSFADTINVEVGDAASLVVGAPTVTDEAAPSPAPAPPAS